MNQFNHDAAGSAINSACLPVTPPFQLKNIVKFNPKMVSLLPECIGSELVKPNISSGAHPSPSGNRL